MLYTAKKIVRAIVDALKAARGSKTTPRLIMTLLVKNEERILEQNLLFHKEMGVDGFIITDNDSTDSTPEIIKKYVDKGWVIETIKDYGTGHLQKGKVDKMIWSAKSCHGADWIINADADELWYSPSGDLKREMSNGANVLRCKSINMYPEEGVELHMWSKLISPIPDDSKYDLSEFHIFKRYTYKVAHAAMGYIRISMGNHKVTMFPSRKKDSEITIFHYNILGLESFIDKTIKSGPRPHLKTKKKKGQSRHWRQRYELYKEGKLEQEYERVIGSQYIDEFEKLGYVYRDNRVAETFKRIYKS